MDVLLKEYRVNRILPENLTPEEEHLFQSELERSFNGCHVFRKMNVFVIPSGPILDGSKVLEEYSFKRNLSHPIDRINIMWQRWLPIKDIQKAIIVHDIWSKGYFHWFGDVLPKLILINQSKYKDWPISMPSTFSRYEYVRESLDLLGVKVIWTPNNKKLRIRNGVFLSHLASTGNYHPETMRTLRINMKSDLKKQRIEKKKRILITRQKAKYRRIVNIEAVKEVIEEYGFELVEMDSLTWYEQKSLLSQTEILIAVHGAGLMNMLFMNESIGKVVELRRVNDNLNNCYFSLASALTLPYYYLTCKASNSKKTQKTNFIVDITNLKTLLKDMID